MADLSFKAQLKTYFMSKIGAFDYRKGWLKSDCPICGAEYKFGINLQSNVARCFKCEYQQQPINLVMHLEDATFTAARGIVRGLQEARYYEKPAEIYERRPAILPNGFRLIDKDDDTILGKRAYKYVTKQRGIDYRQVKRLKLGYVRDSNSTFYNHLIIPYYSGRKLVYFQARNMGIGIKFNNPKVDEFGLGQNTLIFNVDALQRYREVTIVESAINTITIAPKSVAILSKTYSKYQVDILKKAPVTTYNIILDPDAYHKALDLALELVGTQAVRIIKLPEDKDVNDVGREYTEEAIKRCNKLTWQDIMVLKHETQKRRYKYERS